MKVTVSRSLCYVFFTSFTEIDEIWGGERLKGKKLRDHKKDMKSNFCDVQSVVENLRKSVGFKMCNSFCSPTKTHLTHNWKFGNNKIAQN